MLAYGCNSDDNFSVKEIDCHRCIAACCKGPMTIELTAPEHEQMLEAGTQLITIAEPVPYERSDVPHPAGVPLDLTAPEEVVETVNNQGERWPLAANKGRYIMVGSCGNLSKLLGWEYCAIYEDRPAVCRDLEMGGIACQIMRLEKGIDLPSSQLTQKTESTFRWPMGH